MVVLRWLVRHRWFVLAVLFLVALLPLPVAAVSNSDIIAILNAGIDGLVKLVKVAYCAAGVGALCCRHARSAPPALSLGVK